MLQPRPSRSMGCAGSKKGEVADPVDVAVAIVPTCTQREATAAEVEMAAEVAAQAEAAVLEARSATKVQSIVRGKAARAKFELMRRPCDNYRVNMQAEAFGQCVCGWSKAEHCADALSRDVPKREAQIRDDEDVRSRMLTKQMSSCVKYVVNMESANFGECVCGAAKADHTAAALAAGSDESRARSPKITDSPELRLRFVQRARVECEKYVVKMGDNSVAFGTCVCGAPRADHSEAALAAGAGGKKGTTRVSSGEVRAKMVQKERCECECYEVQMADSSVAFGTCVCGEPRSRHTDEALAAGAARGRRPGGKKLSFELRAN